MYVAKTKALISCAADMQPCFRICKSRFFHDAAQSVIVVSDKVGFNQPDMVHMSLVVRKPVFGVSDQVPNKPGCTVT